MQHNKIVRFIAPILVIALLISLSAPASASGNPAYVDVTPAEHYGGGFGSASYLWIPMNKPSWMETTGFGYAGSRVYVIGVFRGSYVSYNMSGTPATLIASAPSSDFVDANVKIFSFQYAYATSGIYVSSEVGASNPYFEILHVYMELSGWEGSLSSVQYSSATLASGYSSVTLPFSSTAPSTEHYFRIPSSMLALSDIATFDFSFSASSVPEVSVFSGSNQLDFINGLDENGRITVSGYDIREDLTVCLYGDFTSLSLNSVSVHYGLLLDETGLLSLINESLNSNFKSLQDLLSSQHEETKGILNDIKSWVSSLHNIVDSGFQSVGSWFTTLWNNLNSKFNDVKTWIQAQTDTLAGKLDILINGTQAQQEAAQQAQDNAAALDQQLGDISSGLQVNQPDQNEISGDVSSYLPADTANVLSTSYGSLISDPSVLPLFMISLTFCLVSFLIFGKRG